jgi:uncharacterized membrane protein
MTGTMLALVLATTFFVGIHPAVSGSPLRPVLVRRIGEAAFQAVFALLSLGGLAWMIVAFEAAPFVPLWVVPELAWVPVLVVPVAIVFVIAGITTPNPTSTGQSSVLEGDVPARGIIRVTRHPFLIGVGLWAASHIVANGEVASLIFFGGFFILSLIGMIDIDRKLARRSPERWATLAEQTSRIPFVAIMAGRNRFEPGEIGWWRVAVSLIVAGVLFGIHERLTGAPVVVAF